MSVRKSEAERFLEPDEIVRLLAAAGASRAHGLYAICVVMLNLGLRVGEALSIRLRDISPNARSVRVRTEKRRRETWHTLDVAPAVALVLQRQVRIARNCYSSPWLFPSGWRRRPGEPWTRRGVQLAFAAAVKAAGIDRAVTPHSLRHTRATMLYRASGDLRLVAHDLRHSDDRSASVYVGLDGEAYRKACRSVPSFT